MRVTAPPGHSLWHGGITATLESNYIHFDKDSGQQLVAETLEVADAGTVAGTVDFNFDFEEGIGIGSGRFRESYEGDHFAIRHSISVTVARPWYTFPVQKFLTFGAQELHLEVSQWDLMDDHLSADEADLPRPGNASPRRRAGTGPPVAALEDGAGEGGEDGTGTGEGSDEGGPRRRLGSEERAELEAAQHAELYEAVVDDAMAGVPSTTGPILTIPDCGGIAVFDFEKDTYSLESVLEGTVQFGYLVHPVTRVTLRVIKEETIGKETYTDQVFAADLLNAALFDAKELQSLRAARDAAAASSPSGTAKTPTDSSTATPTVVHAGSGPLTEAQLRRLEEIENNSPIVGEGELNVSLDLSQLTLAPTTLQSLDTADQTRIQADAVPDEADAGSDESDDSDFVSDVQIAKYKEGLTINWPVVKYYLQLVVSTQRASSGDGDSDGEEEQEADVSLPVLQPETLQAALSFTQAMVEGNRAAQAQAGQGKGGEGEGEGGEDAAPADMTPAQEAASITQATPRGLFYNTHELVLYRSTWSAEYIPPDKRQLAGVTQVHGESDGTATLALPRKASSGTAGGAISPQLASAPAPIVGKPPLAAGGEGHGAPPLVSPTEPPSGAPLRRDSSVGASPGSAEV